MSDPFLKSYLLGVDDQSYRQRQNKINQVAALLNPQMYSPDPLMDQQAIQEIVDSYRLTKAEQAIDRQDVDAIQSLSQLYGMPPTPDEAVAAGQLELLGPMETEQFNNFLETQEAKPDSGINYAIRRAKEYADRARAERLESAREINLYRDGPKLGTLPDNAFGHAIASLNYARQTVGLWADAFLLPGWSARMGKILNKFDPQGADWTNHVQGEDARRRITALIATLPPDESKELVDELITAVDEMDGGWFSRDNALGKASLIQEIVRPLAEGDPKFFTLDVVQPIEYTSVILDVGSAVRGVQMALSQVARTARGTAADDLIKTFEGSRRYLDLAAGSPSSRWAARPSGAPPGGMPGTSLVRTNPGADAALDRAGTDAASVIGELLLPKRKISMDRALPGAKAVLDDLNIPRGKPYLDPTTLGDARLHEIGAELAQVYRHSLGNRLNDYNYAIGDKGLDITIRIGDKNGLGFGTKEAAELAAKALRPGGKAEVVRDQLGNWQVQWNETYGLGVDHMGPYITGETRAWWTAGVSAASRISRRVFSGAQSAVAATAQEKLRLRELAEPIAKLSPGRWEKVAYVLEKRDVDPNIVSRPTRQDFLDAGLRGEEVDAAMAYRKLADEDWRRTNEEVWQQLNADGYKEWRSSAGRYFVKLVPSGLLPSHEHLRATKAIDMHTGKTVSLSTRVMPAHDLYRLAEPLEDGTVFAIARKDRVVSLRNLPDNVLKYDNNYTRRDYTAPYFIREIIPGSRSAARWTAQSDTAALRAVDKLNAAAGFQRYEVRAATELEPTPGNLGSFLRARDEGRLVTSRRNPTPLQDIDGLDNMQSLRDSVDVLLNSTAMKAGIGKWVIAQREAFNKAFKEVLGWDFDAVPPFRGDLPVHKRALYDEAKRVYDYIHFVAGVDAAGPAGDSARTFTGAVADGLFRSARKVRITSKGIIGKEISFGQTLLAENISGMNPTIVQGLKSLAAAVYLIINAPIQIGVQSGAAFVHAGARGGYSYLLYRGAEGTNMLMDLIAMTFANMPELERTLRSIGISSKRARLLNEQYRFGGLNALINEHVMVLGTVGNSRFAGRTRVGRKAGQALGLLKAIGFDLGTSIDSKAAFLFARNRALRDGKTLDAHTLKQVVQDAMTFQGNQNRADPFVNPKRMLSLFAQFKSFPVKMATRALSVATLGRYGREAGLSVAEQARFLVASSVLWGARGFGAIWLVRKALEKADIDLPDWAIQVLEDGIEGSIINTMFAAADEEAAYEGDEPLETRLLVSQRFSPFTSIGEGVSFITDVAKVMWSMDMTQVVNLLPDPAGFGPVTDSYKAIKFLLKLRGVPPEAEPPPGEAIVAMRELFRVLPPVSNYTKFKMAQKTGYLMTQDGAPVTQVAGGEVIGLLLGLRPERAEALREANAMFFDKYTPPSAIDEGFSRDIGREARNTFEFMEKLYSGIVDEAEKKEAMEAFLDNHNIAWYTALEPEQYVDYQDALQQLIDESGMPYDMKFLDRVAGTDFPITDSMRNKLSGLPEDLRNSVMSLVGDMFEPIEQDDIETEDE